MKTDNLSAYIAVLMFLTLASCSSGNSSNANSATAVQKHIATPAVVFNVSDSLLNVGCRDTINLGRISQGEVVGSEFAIHNADKNPIIILSVESSCGCTKVDFPREPIKPGTDAVLSFEFNSKGFSGHQLKRITVLTSLNSQPIRLIVTSEVIVK